MNILEEKVRLVKFISAVCGAASRRQAGDLVKAGRVKLNGKVCTDPSQPAGTSDVLELDGKIISVQAQKYYFMLNKPPGYVCSNADPHADKKAIDLIDEAKQVKLFSAGRLDKDSEGLIIFSNDGDFNEKLTHPSHGVLKRYELTTAAPISPEFRRRMTDGIMDDGELLRAEAVKELGENFYLFTLNEGKKREIRRMARQAGAPVVKLKRVAVGNLFLSGLPLGKYRTLTPNELKLILNTEKHL